MDYIDSIIENYVKGKRYFAETKITKKGKSIDKDYPFNDYADLWSLAKQIFKKKLSIKKAKEEQNNMKKNLLNCMIGFINRSWKKLGVNTKKN